MLKAVLCVCLFVAFSEAKFNKYERLRDVMTMVQNDPILMKMYENHVHDIEVAKERLLGKTKRQTNTFSCMNGYSMSTTVPTSVHALKPENINVVAALGDSLTAGNGILGTNILHCLNEYRGRSWSIGGDLNYEQGVKTLPNILRHYNRNLKGASVNMCDSTNYGCSMLNVAVAGETSQDMPTQARELVSRLNNPGFGVNMTNDWKMITLFIGGNDLCDYCHDTAKYQPANYIGKIREALDILHANVPRAFINMAQIFDISPLASVSQGIFCNLVTNMVCDCAKDTSNHATLSAISRQYQQEIEKLVASGRYDTRDDFTVVLQPFFQNTEPVKTGGKYDLAYFAPDCFHFSELGQYAAAKSLWNNMFEPVGQKAVAWDLASPTTCPLSGSAGVFKTKNN